MRQTLRILLQSTHRKSLTANLVFYTTNMSSATSTVIEAEKEKFDSWHSSWWKPGSPGDLLKRMNSTRVPFIRDGLLNLKATPHEVRNGPKPLLGFKILDAGCGGGVLSEALARLGATVVGVDVAPKLIEIAKAHAELDESLTSGLTYVSTTLEEHSEVFPDHYDAVVSSEVVEHVDNPENFVRVLAKLVKPNGSLFFTTINRTFKSFVVAIILGEHILKRLPIGTHHYSMLVKPEELQSGLEKSGCEVRMIQGMRHTIDRKAWEFCKSTEVWYAMHAIKTA